MNEEYIIYYPDGSEVGPFDEQSLQEMDQNGEIPPEAKIMPASTEYLDDLTSYLEDLHAQEVDYVSLAADDRQQIETHFNNLLSRGPSRWDGQEAKIIFLITSLRGRKEIYSEYASYRTYSLMETLADRLDLLNDHLRETATMVSSTDKKISQTLTKIAEGTTLSAMRAVQEIVDDVDKK